MYSRILTAVLTVMLGFSGTAALAAKPADPFPDAVKLLKDKDSVKRRQGVEQLRVMRNPAAFQPLLNLLKDKVPAVRVAACDALGTMRSREAARDIADLLRSDPEPSVRQTAAISLGYIGDRETIPALI